MSDLSSSSLNLLQYADDIALKHQARKFEECEIHLKESLKMLRSFFHHWRLRPSKTQGSILGTHYANRKLTVQFDNILFTHVDHLKYLGMTLDLDRTLSYKTHLENWNEGELSCQLSLKIVRH
jgi:hypothetical protein